MQVNQALYGYNAPNSANVYSGEQPADEAGLSNVTQPVGEERPNARNASGEAEQQDKLELSNEGQTTGANNIEAATSRPQDNSSKLVQRLVAALGQFEVRQVLADIHKDLMSLRVTAAIGKGEDAALAKAYVKKLEKLAGRADRKLSDLNSEDMMKLQRVRLEQQKQKQRVEEIKDELRRKQSERRTRENGYLLEDLQEQMFGSSGSYNPAFEQLGGSEAAIAAQAEAIASAEIQSESAGLSGGEISQGVSAEPISGAEADTSVEISVNVN